MQKCWHTTVAARLICPLHPCKNQALQGKSAPLLSTVSLKLIELLSPHPSLCHCVGLVFLLDEGARPTTRSLPVSCVLCVQQLA